MENIKVSIIIPVYNAEKYINRCLKSIINQTLKEIEIIIVNDGSTDNSLNVVNEIAKKDNRVHVFTQVNKGAARARNLGISKSKGVYIGFVDIDDYVERNMYFELNSEAAQGDYDIVTCSFVEEGANNINYFENALIDKDKIEGQEIKELYFKYIVQDKTIGYLPLWNKIFKRDFIINNNLYINEEMVFGEDRIFCREAFLKAKKICNVNKILYHYLKCNDESITIKYSVEKVRDYLLDRREMINFILANLKDKEMLENGLMIYNERIFYRIIDYSIKEVRTNKGLFEKYINMKEIMDIKEIKEMNFDRIKLSISMRVLVILLKLRCYPLIYLCLYIKSKIK